MEKDPETPEAETQPEAPELSHSEVAEALAQQHLDWARKRPADYKVPY